MAGGIIPFILQAAGIVEKTMDMLPDYPEAKRKELYKLRREYKNELQKDLEQIDSLALEHKYDKLRVFIETFHQELHG